MPDVTNPATAGIPGVTHTFQLCTRSATGTDTSDALSVTR